MERGAKECSDCADSENFYPMTAIDESGPVGHLTLRFGFVIVDDTKRGMGYGQEMLRLALGYAFDMLKVEMDRERWCDICGEMCRIIEMEIIKK